MDIDENKINSAALNSLKYLIETGKQLKDSKSYAGQIQDYYVYAESVKNYLEKNLKKDLSILKGVDLNAFVHQESTISFFSYLPGLNLSSFKIADENIELIIQTAEIVYNRIRYR